MARNDPKAPKAAGPSTRGLRVVAKVDGFRRAGRAWTGSTTVPLSELTEDQVDQLKGERMLIVDEVDITEQA